MYEELIDRLYAHCNTDRSDAITNEAADALKDMNERYKEAAADATVLKRERDAAVEHLRDHVRTAEICQRLHFGIV